MAEAKKIMLECNQASVRCEFYDRTKSFPRRRGSYVWVYNTGTQEFDELERKCKLIESPQCDVYLVGPNKYIPFSISLFIGGVVFERDIPWSEYVVKIDNSPKCSVTSDRGNVQIALGFASGSNTTSNWWLVTSSANNLRKSSRKPLLNPL